MSKLSTVCVYCGSSSNVRESYKQAARQLGAALVEAGIDLIYGGGDVGIMGITAEAVLSNGGKVTGIIPEFLEKSEIGKDNLTELMVVPSMHIRKQHMAEMSDGFIVLPGGFGTLDELFEILTWRQLSLHNKPIVIVNIDGYWDPLVQMVDHIVAEGFAAEKNLSLIQTVSRVEDVVPALEAGAAEDNSVSVERL